MSLFNRTAVFSFVLICIIETLAHKGAHNSVHNSYNTYRQGGQQDLNSPFGLGPPEHQSTETPDTEEADQDPREEAGVSLVTPSRYIEAECATCYLLREEAKMIRIEHVKRTILDRLQMTSPPNKSNVVLPHNAELSRFLKQHLLSQSNDHQNDEPVSSLEPSTRIEKMILFPKKPPSHWNLNQNTSYAFTFSEKLFNYDVKDASLHIHVRTRRIRDSEPVFYLYLRRVHDPPGDSNNPSIKAATRTKILMHRQWVVLNLTSVAQEWLDYPEEHNVIQVELLDEDGNSRDDLLDTNSDSSYRKKSFLMMNIKEKQHHRFRRALDETMTCAERSAVTTCCKYPMEIDFEAIGWDWIIAPRRYDANYCQGECPRMHMLQYAHSFLRQALESPPVKGTGPCCAPRKMSDLQMLHSDADENIRLTTIAEMIVDSCNCA